MDKTGLGMHEPLSDRWLSVEEVAQYLGINKGTLYKWVTRKDIPAHKMGRLWKFKKDEIDEWVRTGGVGDKRSLNSNFTKEID